MTGEQRRLAAALAKTWPQGVPCVQIKGQGPLVQLGQIRGGRIMPARPGSDPRVTVDWFDGLTTTIRLAQLELCILTPDDAAEAMTAATRRAQRAS